MTNADSLLDIAELAQEQSAWVSPEKQRDALAEALRMCLPMLPKWTAEDAQSVLDAVFPFEVTKHAK